MRDGCLARLADVFEGVDASAETEEIKKLKARYFRTMDGKDWAAMREVFADDVVMDTSEAGGGVIEGADAFLDFLRPTLEGAVTVHHGHMPEIEILGPAAARGVWALEDNIIWPDGTRLRGFGHYHETYEKLEGSWKIKTSVLTRLHVDLTTPRS